MSKTIGLTAALSTAFATLALGGPAAVADEAPEKVIAAKLPGVAPEQITPAPIAGVYEIGMGTSIAYVSADARYLLRGDIIDLTNNVNITEQRKSHARVALLDAVGEDNMIVFAPGDRGKQKYAITVFTDIDCGYCRKLHQEMTELNDLGVEVRYMFYPRSGPGTASWHKAEEVWCSADRNDALTRAKAGENVTSDACGTTPVAQHFETGRQVGVRGTPAILTEDGTLISGYLPAPQLVARLESVSKTQSAAAQ